MPKGILKIFCKHDFQVYKKSYSVESELKMTKYGDFYREYSIKAYIIKRCSKCNKTEVVEHYNDTLTSMDEQKMARAVSKIEQDGFRS